MTTSTDIGPPRQEYVLVVSHLRHGKLYAVVDDVALEKDIGFIIHFCIPVRAQQRAQ